MEAFEDFRVDEIGGAEPATVEVNPRDVAACDAHVHDLDRVRRYATW